VQTKDGAHSYAHWDMGSADRPRGSGFGVVEFDADTLQEVNEQFFYSQVVTECPQAGGQYEHQSGTHGDVCRNPGAPWDCPTGCSITSGRQAPYCLVRMPPGVADKLCRQTSVDEAGNGDQDISVMASYLAGIPSGRPVAITRAPEVVVGAYSTYAVAINAALQSMGIDGPPESTQVARECLQAGARYEHQSGSHGDVCRNPGAPWDCPTGCSITEGRQAPYCQVTGTVLTGDRQADAPNLCRQISVVERNGAFTAFGRAGCSETASCPSWATSDYQERLTESAASEAKICVAKGNNVDIFGCFTKAGIRGARH